MTNWKRIRSILFLSFILLTCMIGYVNCGSNGGVLSGSDPLLEGQTATLSVKIPTVSIAANSEITRCMHVRAGNSAEVLIRKIQLQMDTGIAQVLVSKSQNIFESSWSPCTPLDTIEVLPAIFNALPGGTEITFPTTSAGPVGPILPANQMLAIEVHFYNPGPVAMDAGADLHLEVLKTPVNAIESGLQLTANKNVYIEPGTTVTTHEFSPATADVKIFALQTQTWRTATSIRVSMPSDSMQLGPTVYENSDWQISPIFLNIPELEMRGKGLRTECTWTNTGPLTLVFGPSIENSETCMVWSYYY